MKIIEPDQCPRCGSTFHCSKSSRCWCYEISIESSILEKIQDTYNSCLCPDCLNEVSKQEKQTDKFAKSSK